MIEIAGRSIGRGHPPFIIAEMSGNHNQSLDRALKIVDAAAEAGAHAIKLQTYTADTMTLDLSGGDFTISDPASLWAGKSLYQLYEEAHTPWDWQRIIFAHAKERGLICLSTPFDDTAVDFLEELGAPCYKVASFENTDLPLIRRIAATGKPMIISTGMATISELDDTIRAARESGCDQIILLQCTSTYPATPENSNLVTIPHMRDLFRTEVGLSDHTMGVGVAVASVAFGATVIEKHFTLARADGGVDSAFSMEPSEMAQLVVESERAWLALGKIEYGPLAAELKSIQFRRSLYVTEDLGPGEVLTNDNVRAIRPGFGLAPKYKEIVIGQSVPAGAKRGTPVTWDLLRTAPDKIR